MYNLAVTWNTCMFDCLTREQMQYKLNMFQDNPHYKKTALNIPGSLYPSTNSTRSVFFNQSCVAVFKMLATFFPLDSVFQ